MRTSARTHRLASDAGLGLIELIVGMLVTTIVLVGVATILVSSWLTQQDVVATTSATDRGQLFSSMIERAMRNARDFTVLPSDANGTELRVWTSLDNLECQGFHLGSPEATFATTSGTTLPAVIDWRTWATGVRPVDNDPANHFFVRTGDTVRYSFEIYDAAAGTAPVQFAGEVSIRSTGEEGTSLC